MANCANCGMGTDAGYCRHCLSHGLVAEADADLKAALVAIAEPGERIGVADLLKKLRDEAAPDRIFTNDFGDRVWLMKCELNGKIVGVTDCCLASEPCDYHASLTHEAPAAKQ